MSVAPARRAALRALSRIRRETSFSGPVLASVLAQASLTGEDAALATRLTYGVLSAEGVLDSAIGRHASRSLEPRVADALRLSAFELLYGRAPAYAVVDQAVRMVRSVRPEAAGLTNAVMRKLAAEADSFPWGDPATDRDALGRASAHPRWIVDLAFESLGEAAAREMLSCGLEAAPTYVRLDPFAAPTAETRAALAGADPQQCEVDDDCLMLATPSAAFRSGADRRGWFPMDAGAQFAARACAPLPGMLIADVGAGRGGKTVCLQSIAVRRGAPATIVAIEVHEGKTRVLEDRLRTGGVPSVQVITADATTGVPMVGTTGYDVVLLDAPCSGLGTLRRYPEKRWRLDPGIVPRMAELQSELIAAAAHAVRPGGRLVYSTCSIAEMENARVVREFLDSDAGRGFSVDPLDALVPAGWRRFLTRGGTFQSWPASGGPDGHFVAALRRGDL